MFIVQFRLLGIQDLSHITDDLKTWYYLQEKYTSGNNDQNLVNHKLSSASQKPENGTSRIGCSPSHTLYVNVKVTA